MRLVLVVLLSTFPCRSMQVTGALDNDCSALDAATLEKVAFFGRLKAWATDLLWPAGLE